MKKKIISLLLVCSLVATAIVIPGATTAKAAEPTNIALNATAETTHPWSVGNIGAGHGVDALIDGVNENDPTYFGTPSTPDLYEEMEVTLTFDKTYHISQIQVYPFVLSGAVQGFPEDFRFEAYTQNGWEQIGHYTGYTAPVAGAAVFDDITAVDCSAVRMVTEKNGYFNGTKYILRLNEVEVYGVEASTVVSAPPANIAKTATATASHAWGNGEAFDPPALIDGRRGSSADPGASSGGLCYYGTGSMVEQTEEVTVTLTFDKTYSVDQIKLTPALSESVYTGGFPEDFRIEAYTGTEWKVVKTVSGQAVPTNVTAITYDIEPTECTAVRLVVTKQGLFKTGPKYILRLSEMEVYGVSVLSDVEKHKLAVQNFDKISIEHFGFANGTYTESKDSGVQDFSIFNTMFTTKIQAGAVGEIWPYTELQYAKSDSWDGIRVAIASTQMVVYKDVGYVEYWKNEFVGEFEFSISTELFDLDGDGEDDVRMGFWLNGVLLGDAVHVIENGKELLTARMALVHNTEQDWTLKSTTVQPEQPEETLTDAEAHKLAVKNFRETCIEDFGIAEKNYTESVDSGAVEGISVLNTVFTTTVKAATASDNFSRFCYAVPKGQDLTYGIQVQVVPAGNQIDFLGKKADGTKLIDTTTYWKTEFAKDFQLSISTELYDVDSDGLDDIRLGFWLNGVLLGDKVHVIIDGKQEFSTARIGFNRIGDQDFLLEKSAMQIGSEFEQISPADFGAENVKTNGVDFQTYSTENVTSLDGKIFSTDIRFGTESSQIIYGADTRYDATGEYGFYLGTNEAGSFVLRDKGQEFVNVVLDDYKAGVILKDNFFNLKISSKNVDCDGDDAYDDMELGLWFNDTLYDNRYFYYEGCADMLAPDLGYITGEGATMASGEVIWGNYVQEVPTEVVWDLASGYYYADILDGESLKIDETEYTSSQILSIPKTYEVEYTENSGLSTFKDSVTVYLTNDIRGDGTVDIRDLVAMKLYANDERGIDSIGEMSIGVGTEGYLHDTALAGIRAELVSEEERIMSKEFSQEIVGATGSDTYITYAGATDKGSAVLGFSATSDGYTPNLVELNKYETDYILDFNFEENRDVRVLQLSDTQIIDSAQAEEGRLWPSEVEKYDISQVDELLFKEMDALVAAQKPDFITIAGDVVYGEFDNNGSVLQMLIERMDSYQIPWAPIFGNHDNETTLGADWQCKEFMKSKYCIFNQNNQYGGNGNYSVVISKKGEVQRLIFMVDTHGCYMVENPISPGYLPKQLAWYRDVAAQVSVAAGKQVPSFIFQHYTPIDTASLLVEKGYRPTMSSKIKIDLGLTSDGTNDFGFLNSPDVPEFRQYMYPQYQAAGTDAVFFGHSHINSLSAIYKGIRYTFGLKTGRYVSSPDQTGGTLITISNEGAFTVEHIVQRDITTEAN